MDDVIDPAALEEAVERLRAGEIVAYPTETFYGLAVDAFDEQALERLQRCKGRAMEKTVSVIIADWANLVRLCSEIPPTAAALMDKHWPGPLTLALPARPGLPSILVAEGCVAVRESPHPVARALSLAFGGPITATSANLAGAAPATTAVEVRASFADECFVLDGGSTPGGKASTLVRVRDSVVEVLRPGPIQIDV